MSMEASSTARENGHTCDKGGQTGTVALVTLVNVPQGLQARPIMGISAYCFHTP